MQAMVGLIRNFFAVGFCTGLCAAQWSAVETQQVVPAVVQAEVGFGEALDVSGGTALVGSYWELGSYVFEIDPSTGAWVETARLDGLSNAVAISGGTAVIGGQGAFAGSATVFERDANTGAWIQSATLSDPFYVVYNSFGEILAISGDTIAVGSSGVVSLFERNEGGPGAWGLAGALGDTDPAESLFGLALDIEEDLLLVGARGWDQGDAEDVGAVYVFQRSGGGAWNQVAFLVADDAAEDDRFGGAVAVSGSTAIIGASGDDHAGGIDAGSVYVFEQTASGWQQISKRTSAYAADGLGFGSSVALDFDTAAVGASTYQQPHYVAVLKRNQGGVGAWGTASEWPVGEGFSGSLAISGSALALDDAFGGTSVFGIRALAFDPTAGVLHGVDYSGYLVTLDRVTAEATLIGPTGFTNIHGLAFDSSSGILYATDIDLDQLIRIDPVSGAGTAIGPLGFKAVRGLEFDPLTSTLYGSDNSTDQLVTIDVQTGAATAVGSIGFDKVKGLAIDPGTGTLYGVTEISPELIAIDTQTGMGTLIGPMNLYYNFDCGLAMDTSTGTLFGSSFNLVALDQQTGAGTEIGEIVSTAIGPVHVYEISHASEPYCTAGTSASGCTALIAASGQASSSAPSGFVVSASGVEGAKDALFFFGTFGKQANPWGNGTSYQCVKPPLRRTGLLSGTGTAGACDGLFARDLNAFWCATCPGSAVKPPAGAMGQAQLWYRDSASTSNQPTSLSDAIEFYVSP